MTVALCAAAICVVLTIINLVSIGIAIARLRRRYRLPPPAGDAEPVAIIRPVCGIEPFIEGTLASSFTLDYPRYELIFCVQRANDPVVPVVRGLMAAYPNVDSRLLVGDDRVSDNPKLNNCIKGWHAAHHEWIILADSNVLMPQDYIQQLMARWQTDTGLVCSTPIGSRPSGLWAEVECAFLNTFQARWQYVGESIGLGFAQGKSMLWKRTFLQSRGGLRALAAEIAEDAAATKLVRNAGRQVHLVDAPFEQPLGHRTAQEVWTRQIRWARLRRVTFPMFFAPEILTGAVVPLATGAYAAAAGGYSVAAVVTALLVLWYGPEVALAMSKDWHVSWRLLIACVVRDCLVPPMWICGWFRGNVVWRGNAIDIRSKSMTQLQDGTSVI